MMHTSTKYPRTPHMPLSPSYTMDDEHMIDFKYFEDSGENVVVTEKMDGENTTLYSTHWHARGVGYPRSHPSRDWMSAYWANVAASIPGGWRVCGENLYAKHSIHYQNLPAYFLVFNVWNAQNEALSWNATVDFCEKAGMMHVPVLYQGPFHFETLTTLLNMLDLSIQEGIVIRPSGAIPYDEFGRRVAKWVRPNHIQSEKHWFQSKVIKNGLRAS